jgi:hypothetical protein
VVAVVAIVLIVAHWIRPRHTAGDSLSFSDRDGSRSIGAAGEPEAHAATETYLGDGTCGHTKLYDIGGMILSAIVAIFDHLLFSSSYPPPRNRTTVVAVVTFSPASVKFSICRMRKV